jgi:hypothetical protein
MWSVCEGGGRPQYGKQVNQSNSLSVPFYSRSQAYGEPDKNTFIRTPVFPSVATKQIENRQTYFR